MQPMVQHAHSAEPPRREPSVVCVPLDARPVQFFLLLHPGNILVHPGKVLAADSAPALSPRVSETMLVPGVPVSCPPNPPDVHCGACQGGCACGYESSCFGDYCECPYSCTCPVCSRSRAQLQLIRIALLEEREAARAVAEASLANPAAPPLMLGARGSSAHRAGTSHAMHPLPPSPSCNGNKVQL
jgi:hypothetical protein